MRTFFWIIILVCAAAWALCNVLLGALVAPTLFSGVIERPDAGVLFGNILGNWLTWGWILCGIIGCNLLFLTISTIRQKQPILTLINTALLLALIISQGLAHYAQSRTAEVRDELYAAQAETKNRVQPQAPTNPQTTVATAAEPPTANPPTPAPQQHTAPEPDQLISLRASFDEQHALSEQIFKGQTMLLLIYVLIGFVLTVIRSRNPLATSETRTTLDTIPVSEDTYQDITAEQNTKSTIETEMDIGNTTPNKNNGISQY